MKSTDSRKWRPDVPRRLRMAAKRVQIVRAARPILLRDGLGGTTLDRIAAPAAEIQKPVATCEPSRSASWPSYRSAVLQDDLDYTVATPAEGTHDLSVRAARAKWG